MELEEALKPPPPSLAHTRHRITSQSIARHCIVRSSSPAPSGAPDRAQGMRTSVSQLMQRFCLMLEASSLATRVPTLHRTLRSSLPARLPQPAQTGPGPGCDSCTLLEEDAEWVRLRSGCTPRPPLERGLTTCRSGDVQQDQDGRGERAEEVVQLGRAVLRRGPCRCRQSNGLGGA